MVTGWGVVVVVVVLCVVDVVCKRHIGVQALQNGSSPLAHAIRHISHMNLGGKGCVEVLFAVVVGVVVSGFGQNGQHKLQ